MATTDSKESPIEEISYGLYHKPYPSTVHATIEPDSIAHIGDEQNAIDFLVPEGTLVLAPRSGKVIAVKEDSHIGGPDEKFADQANYIVLDHGGGETSILVHLAPASVIVKPGETVLAGQQIARQGSTGWTYAPHIHFGVYRNRKTVKIRFI